MKLFSDMLRDNTLSQAIAAVRGDIAIQPDNADLRASLTQLLCLQGDWSAAKAQLKAWLVLTPAARPTITLLEQAVEAEIQRQQVFEQQASPALLKDDAPWVALMAQALRAGPQDASALRLQALESAPLNPGQLRRTAPLAGGDPLDEDFDWLTDGDDRLGPLCELFINGVYHWISFSHLQFIKFQAPASVTDLVWRHCLVRWHDGREQVCQLPVRYPFHAHQEDAVRLAQTTEWIPQDDDNYIGQGQRCWLYEDRQFPLLELMQIQFTAAAL